MFEGKHTHQTVCFAHTLISASHYRCTRQSPGHFQWHLLPQCPTQWQQIIKHTHVLTAMFQVSLG